MTRTKAIKNPEYWQICRHIVTHGDHTYKKIAELTNKPLGSVQTKIPHLAEGYHHNKQNKTELFKITALPTDTKGRPEHTVTIYWHGWVELFLKICEIEQDTHEEQKNEFNQVKKELLEQHKDSEAHIQEEVNNYLDGLEKLILIPEDQQKKLNDLEIKALSTLIEEWCSSALRSNCYETIEEMLIHLREHLRSGFEFSYMDCFDFSEDEKTGLWLIQRKLKRQLDRTNHDFFEKHYDYTKASKQIPRPLKVSKPLSNSGFQPPLFKRRS